MHKKTEPNVQRLTSRLGNLNEIARNLSSDLDMERIVQAVTDSATQLVGARFGAFFYNVLDEAGEHYQLYTLSGAPIEAFEKFGLPRNSALFEPTFRGEGIVRCDNVLTHPLYGKSPPHHGMPKGHLPVVSYLAVPVISRAGTVHGGLFFGHEKPGVFTQEAEELVGDIAVHAAIAIDNALLLQTAQRQAERHRIAERDAARLAAIVESSDDAIVSKNLDGVVTSWNKGAEQLFGYAASEMIGQPILVLLPPGREDEERNILARIRRGEPIEHFETLRRRKDGTFVDVSLRISPIKDRNGRIIGASKIARDISERKRAEESLSRHMNELSALYALTDRLHRAETLEETYAAALDAILRAMPSERASILMADEEGVMKFVAWRGLSDRYRGAVEGHSPWQPGETNAQTICVPDAQASDMSDELKQEFSAERIGALAFIPIAAGRKLIGKFMVYYEEPGEFSQGQIEVALAVARQLAFGVERIRSEEVLRQQQEHERARAEELQAIMEAVPAVVWIARDPEAKVIIGNRTAYDVLRMPPDSNLSVSAPEGEQPTHFQVLVGGKRVPSEDLPVQRAARGQEVHNYEEEIRFDDGTSCHVLGNATPLHDADGNPAGAIAAFVDITDRKKAEEQRDLLIAELNHRVKNTLATVVSIARQSFSRNKTVENAYASFEDRIRGLASTHTRLAESNWSGVSMETLLLDEVAPYRREDARNVTLSGPAIELNPKCALTLGMAIHELATNAAKYGALSAKEGALAIDWKLLPAESRLLLRWSELGGPEVTPPGSAGFGRVLIERALAADLGGEVQMEFAPTGLQCTVNLPLENCLVQAS